jgi:ABC-2 type transport system ATP-binding protein
MSPPAIKTHQLTRSYGATPVLRGLDLQVERGTVFGLLGPNGAGKTTTLDVVLGLTTADSGTARVFGVAPRQAVLAGRISAVLQTGGLLHDLTVRETVQMIASTFPTHEPVDRVIERADLTALAKRKVSKCSGG